MVGAEVTVTQEQTSYGILEGLRNDNYIVGGHMTTFRVDRYCLLLSLEAP